MATMIPDSYDESTTSEAERTLYFQLANHLDDTWTVIHSLPYLANRPQLREGECDFLLLHPRYGLLVLEAKSGAPHYDGRKRQWRYDDGKTITDPFAQASRGMHFLNDLLYQRLPAWRHAHLAHGYAVAFPDANSVTGDLRPDLDMSQLFLESDLARLQDAVVRMLAKFNPPLEKADSRLIDGILDVLLPSFSLVPALGGSSDALAPTIESAHREFLRLTGDQADFLEGFAGNPRLLVRGGAGTGKTLLAVTEARRLAAEGRRVLVLCFNRQLGAYLRAELGNDIGEGFVGTFHELCESVLEQAGAARPDATQPDYWDDALPNAALAALGDYAPRYDAILVDEAQDFRADWWLTVEELLVDKNESTFHLFADENQNLFGRRGEFAFTKPDFVLRRNCRNTGPIAAFTRAAGGLEEAGAAAAAAALPDGPEPVIHEVADEAAERDAVRRTLHDLVHEQGLSPDDIVLLGCHKLEKSSFAGARRLGNLTVRDIESDPAPNTVRYATVHKFKGLEADCVLLTGIDQPSTYYCAEHMARFLYVGGSRARVVLHVFRWGSSGE